MHSLTPIIIQGNNLKTQRISNWAEILCHHGQNMTSHTFFCNSLTFIVKGKLDQKSKDTASIKSFLKYSAFANLRNIFYLRIVPYFHVFLIFTPSSIHLLIRGSEAINVIQAKVIPKMIRGHSYRNTHNFKPTFAHSCKKAHSPYESRSTTSMHIS